MRSGLEQIDKVADKIREEQLTHVDTVVVGDNSSGKSLLLKCFIETIPEWTNVYFIDAVNRGFDIKKVPGASYSSDYKQDVLSTRLRADYFNLQDSFNFYGTWTERIEMIYWLFEERLQKLFEKLTGDSFKITDQSCIGEVRFEWGNGLLSTGYQALVRILLELLYYEKKAVDELDVQHPWIVIDEIDEFLSPRYAARLLPFLRQEFPWARWLVSTHSADFVASAANTNLVTLEDGACEVLDSNDYTSLAEVQVIFDRLFGSGIQKADETDALLRRLMNNKMNHLWDEDDDKLLERLKQKTLSASQQLILRQIQNWCRQSR